MNDITPNIIMVEDEKQIRRFVRSALEAEGCRVFEAETGKQGLVEAGTRKPISLFSISVCRIWTA